MLERLDQLRAAFVDDREIARNAASAAVNVTYHAGAAGEWMRVDAMNERADRLELAANGDSALLAMTAGQRVVAYWYLRAAGYAPASATTIAAARAALVRIAASVNEESNYLVGKCFQVIQDAAERLPETKEVREIYRVCTEGGIDWSQVPRIAPSLGDG